MDNQPNADQPNAIVSTCDYLSGAETTERRELRFGLVVRHRIRP